MLLLCTKDLNHCSKMKLLKQVNIFFIIFILLISIVCANETIHLICTSNTIQKKFSFFYIPKRNVVIWLEKAKEVSIKETKDQKIYFDFHGDFGGGVDTVSSKLFFILNISSGEFLLRKDFDDNKKREQRGKCYQK